MDLQNLVKRAVCKNSFSALLQEKRQPQRSFAAQVAYSPLYRSDWSRVSFFVGNGRAYFREKVCKPRTFVYPESLCHENRYLSQDKAVVGAFC